MTCRMRTVRTVRTAVCRPLLLSCPHLRPQTCSMRSRLGQTAAGTSIKALTFVSAGFRLSSSMLGAVTVTVTGNKLMSPRRSLSSPRSRPAKPKPRRTHITVEEIEQLWTGIEHHRCEIAAAQAIWDDWLDNSPELANEWSKFCAAGGLTAQEFVAFLDGQFKQRSVRQRRHLRLISSRKDTRRPLRQSGPEEVA